MAELASREEIEFRAEQVLARVPDWIWDGERLPVPIEDIADSCSGLLVREVDDLSRAPGAPDLADGQTLSGVLLPRDGEIWVSREEAAAWPARRRFTIGHELGHWHMHRTPTDSVLCRSTIVHDEHRRDRPKPVLDREPRPLQEEEANFFAAALLMPAHLIERHYGDLKGDFSKLCELFGASGAAMGRRLHAVIPRAGTSR